MTNEIVAMKERSAGNESVGEMWIETAIFHQDTTVREILKWADKISNNSKGGRLMLSVPSEEVLDNG